MESAEMTPRFSVIMPLYNKAPYVRKALESVMTQTFANFEVIIIDDGSTDDSLAVCEDFISQLHKETKLTNVALLRQPNAGVAATRNKGVAASHGEYLCFLDADDWWEPAYLAEMDKLISEYSDAGIYASNYIYYKPGKTHVALNLPRGYMDYPKVYYEGSAMPVWTGATCMSRKVYDEMGGFPRGVKLGEDFLLWSKTALHYRVVFCEKPLAYYNNDVPASLRATRNLHAPECHMLWHMGHLAQIEQSDPNWKRLCDKLRVNGLKDYWLSATYHRDAAKELAKVEWSRQSASIQRWYATPRFLLRIRNYLQQLGSYCKQYILHLIFKF